MSLDQYVKLIQEGLGYEFFVAHEVELTMLTSDGGRNCLWMDLETIPVQMRVTRLGSTCVVPEIPVSDIGSSCLIWLWNRSLLISHFIWVSWELPSVLKEIKDVISQCTKLSTKLTLPPPKHILDTEPADFIEVCAKDLLTLKKQATESSHLQEAMQVASSLLDEYKRLGKAVDCASECLRVLEDEHTARQTLVNAIMERLDSLEDESENNNYNNGSYSAVLISPNYRKSRSAEMEVYHQEESPIPTLLQQMESRLRFSHLD
eukprot:PhF_6_TR39075/c0_g1_i1/m.58474